jgi:hypothetical protein
MHRTVAAFLPLLLLAACQTPPLRFAPLQARVTDLRVIDANPREQRYRFDLRLQNPNPVPLSLRGLRIELTLDEVDLDTLQSDQALALPAYGSADLTMELRARDAGLLDRAESLRHPEGPAFGYRLTGTAITANDIPPVQLSGDGELGRPARPPEGP